jgi:hypothetical protein
LSDNIALAKTLLKLREKNPPIMRWLEPGEDAEAKQAQLQREYPDREILLLRWAE